MFYDSASYMLGVIVMAALVAVVVGISIGDFQRKSTNHSSVIASILLTVALLMLVVCLPATQSHTHSSSFSSTAAIIELMLVLTSIILAGIGLVQFFQGHRYRRGRKRALFTIVGDLLFGALLIYQLLQFRDDSTLANAERKGLRAPEAPPVASGASLLMDGGAPASKERAKSTPQPITAGAHADRE